MNIVSDTITKLKYKWVGPISSSSYDIDKYFRDLKTKSTFFEIFLKELMGLF